MTNSTLFGTLNEDLKPNGTAVIETTEGTDVVVRDIWNVGTLQEGAFVFCAWAKPSPDEPCCWCMVVANAYPVDA